MSDLVFELDSILGQHKREKNTEYLWHCPFCNHHNPHLAINVSSGKWHCWVCGASGNRIVSLLYKLRVPRDEIRKIAGILNEFVPITDTTTEPEQLTLPAEYKPLWETTNDMEYRHAMHYLALRGLTASDILKYQLGYCSTGTYSHRIIIPSYSHDGQLNYFVARSYYYDEKLRYKNPPTTKNVVMFESLISWKYPIILCEGVFDAMSIRINAIPLLGKLPSKSLQERIIENRVENIYLALDKDALTTALKMAGKFIDNDVKVHLVEMDGKDPSALGFEKIQQKIKEAKQIDYSSLIKSRVKMISV